MTIQPQRCHLLQGQTRMHRMLEERARFEGGERLRLDGGVEG